uniref:Putative secreted protein n=1 Tax=Ixodes ricinus TaxID=34613 RepID=A0A6B0U2J2_IXORI
MVVGMEARMALVFVFSPPCTSIHCCQPDTAFWKEKWLLPSPWLVVCHSTLNAALADYSQHSPWCLDHLTKSVLAVLWPYTI